MNVSLEEKEILRVYLAETRKKTIHNLFVAHKFFGTVQQNDIYQELIRKIEALSEEEFKSLL